MTNNKISKKITYVPSEIIPQKPHTKLYSNKLKIKCLNKIIINLQYIFADLLLQPKHKYSNKCPNKSPHQLALKQTQMHIIKNISKRILNICSEN